MPYQETFKNVHSSLDSGYILYRYLYCVGAVTPALRRTDNANCAKNGADGRSDDLDRYGKNNGKSEF